MTRQSPASLALILRVNSSGETEYLTQWNNGWNVYSLIGGHVEEGESFRQCCMREIEEELICTSVDYELAPYPYATLRFREFSKAAREETDYHWQVFVTRPSLELLARLPNNCVWVQSKHIQAGSTADGQPIADQVKRVLKAVDEVEIATAANGNGASTRIAQETILHRESNGKTRMNIPSNATPVTWLSEASRELAPEWIEQISKELQIAFASAELRTIIVKQRLSGFENNPQKKMILGIEVQFTNGAHSSVVKIGKTSEVSRDYTAWQACAAKRNVTSRLFIAPKMENVGDDRVVIVYPDVYQFYLNDSDFRNEVGPKDLEAIVKLSIESNHPTSASVERVLTQVFTEAHRCFYRDSREATTDEPILYAIQRSLRIGESDDVLKRWDEPEFIKLRRGADWMTSVNRTPDALTRPEYIDPVDFIRWVVHSRPSLRKGSVIARKESNIPSSAIPIQSHKHDGDNASFAEQWATIPKMLVGPAHGDLHGRNIIAGVVRGQAEWPAVFDFDKMDNDNIVAWDFAKLELELKCRIFQELIDTHEKRCEVRRLLNIQEKRPIPDRVKLTTDEQRVADRIERMEIMFAIERLLLDGTKRLSSANQAMGHDQDFMACIPVTTALGRALRIIFRIRCEAATFLGFARQGRETAWIDEYLFSLVVFGVTSLKWHSANEHLMWKMMSAGVAAAGMSTFAWTGNALEPTDLDSSLSYYPTLFHAYKNWKANRSSDSIPTLRAAIERYPYSVGLRQQLALALLESNDYAEQTAAHAEIESLRNLPIVFRDHEVLCRLGRVFKSRGDAACNWKSSLSDVIQEQLAAYGYYSLARDYYRDGFELSGAHYPGVNAATLSLLVGDPQEQKRLAQAVLDVCRVAPVNSNDRLWLLASAGEASLLLARADQAADFYRNALQAAAPGEVGSVQSMYDQVCRLHWALAGQVTRETIAVFQADPRFPVLEPGPFTNCDL